MSYTPKQIRYMNLYRKKQALIKARNEQLESLKNGIGLEEFFNEFHRKDEEIKKLKYKVDYMNRVNFLRMKAVFEYGVDAEIAMKMYLTELNELIGESPAYHELVNTH